MKRSRCSRCLEQNHYPICCDGCPEYRRRLSAMSKEKACINCQGFTHGCPDCHSYGKAEDFGVYTKW